MEVMEQEVMKKEVMEKKKGSLFAAALTVVMWLAAAQTSMSLSHEVLVPGCAIGQLASRWTESTGVVVYQHVGFEEKGKWVPFVRCCLKAMCNK